MPSVFWLSAFRFRLFFLPMRLGIFGGSFDPVHYGHLILAEQCREQCRLDEVWFVPAASPPHKPGLTLAPEAARVEMLQFALAGNPDFRISRVELDRGGVSYSVQTLQQLHDEDPSRELFFLIGADSLRDFPTWREPERIAELATLVAVNRGFTAPADLDTWLKRLPEPIRTRMQLVEMPPIGISATEIRRRVAEGRSIRYLVPRAVEVYIAEKGLYRERKAEGGKPEETKSEVGSRKSETCEDA
jgi:nicotinate-nucleotide adenylyltransferase